VPYIMETAAAAAAGGADGDGGDELTYKELLQLSLAAPPATGLISSQGKS